MCWRHILREGAEFTHYRGPATRPPCPGGGAYRGTGLSSRACGGSSMNTHSRPNWIPPGQAGLLALTRHEGQTMLVLEDPGGVPLDPNP